MKQSLLKTKKRLIALTLILTIVLSSNSVLAASFSDEDTYKIEGYNCSSSVYYNAGYCYLEVVTDSDLRFDESTLAVRVYFERSDGSTYSVHYGNETVYDKLYHSYENTDIYGTNDRILKIKVWYSVRRGDTLRSGTLYAICD